VKWRVVLGVAGGAVVLTVLFARRLSATHRWGLWCATAASVLVVAYLLFERRDKDALWGYYPIKFTWLAVSAALLIGFGEVAPVLGRLFRRVWGGVGVAVAGALVITAMYQVTAPWYPGSRFTPFALEQERTYDRAANAVFKILDKHPRSFVMGYSRDQFTGLQEDGFINFWLFQMAAKDGDDDIRNLAYHFDPTDVRALCDDVAAAWGDAAWVWTRNPSVATQFETSCRPGQVTVRLHGRLLGGGAG
jgi:hypothetical protein